jgi:UDP-4-amino-4,6-dideoxy-N-acetyl-beta-L-altrosamine transaminase
MLSYGRQSITEADVDAVVAVLRSDFLTQGPMTPQFEQALARCCGSRYAVAVSHGTAALHLACRGIGLGPGDRLWTSPNTFVASANCARYCGAEVDFVDIDPDTGNMSVDTLREKLEAAEAAGRLPAAVMPVHFAGQSCAMAEIATLGRRYGFRVIEDACHALGGRYRDAPVGDCRHSDMAVFSFHPVKTITTGEGGAITTNDEALAERLRLLRGHGITRDRKRLGGSNPDGWYYEQVDLGYNYRLTDLQAALGLSQLQRLDAHVGARRDLARRYHETLAGLPLALPRESPDCASAWHLYVVRVEAGAEQRRAVFEGLRGAGIGVQVHYIPVHLQPYYRRLGFRPGDFPQAERHYAQALTLPLFPDLTETEQRGIVALLREALDGAGPRE